MKLHLKTKKEAYVDGNTAFTNTGRQNLTMTQIKSIKSKQCQ